MLTRIDHVMICPPSLEQGIEAYTRIGFDIHLGGASSSQGTHNAIAFLEDDYLELASISDRAAYLATSPGGGLADFLARGGGFRYVIVQSDDLAADVRAMQARGVEVREPTDGSRRTPAGQLLRWKLAVLGGATRCRCFSFSTSPRSPSDACSRPGRPTPEPGAQNRPRVHRGADLAAAIPQYSRVLGMAAPPVQRGAVIKADMAVFDLGPTGLTIAQPAEPGPADEALRSRGPGPFQVLYRTGSMDAAARWMTGHGMPAPARGIRNNGEQAMLVGPEHACGAYIGFVGPA
jgi:hypothetical protein